MLKFLWGMFFSKPLQVQQQQPKEMLAKIEKVAAKRGKQKIMRHFFSKVAGVSQENDDGSSRQKNVKSLRAGDQLIAVPEPSNQYDPDAVKILIRSNGKQIGYLSAGRLAKDVAKEISNYLLFVKEVTGGGKKFMGVNIMIVYVPDDTPVAQIQAYCQKSLEEAN